METMTNINSKSKKEYKRWEKSERINDYTKTLIVEEVENGYIVSISTDGKNKKGQWEYDCKKWISEENPLENTTPVEKKEDTSLMEAIEQFNESF